MPGMGAPRDNLRPGLRQWVYGEYLILYQIDGGGIFVVRVVHGRRDLSKIFPSRGSRDESAG